MSKNEFKKSIQNRYKGRGNSWVKVLKGQEGSNLIEEFLSSVDIKDKKSYMEHTSREGFFWIRYSKVEGESNNPLVRFEIRHRDSKQDHPESAILIEDRIAKDFALLGNTPVKMQLEVNPENRKSKKEMKPIKQRHNSTVTTNEVLDVQKEISIIKEISLSKPTNHELEEWYEFLKINNLYEENV